MVTGNLADELALLASRDSVAIIRWFSMPWPNPKRCYWPHPLPQRGRRVLYGAWAALMVGGYLGSSTIQGVDLMAPLLFGVAAGWCAAGTLRVESLTVWAVSGLAVFCSYFWRLGQIFVLELGWTDQAPPDSSAMASSAYMGLLIGSAACWLGWLHPRVDGG